jgi:hypothetical protein
MHYADSCCTVTENYKPDHTYTFTGPCVVTRKMVSVTVPAAGLFKLRQGAHIQDAFPELSVDDREFLISGMSAEGWKLTFGTEEDEEADE